jgi:hypothetical protein
MIEWRLHFLPALTAQSSPQAIVVAFVQPKDSCFTSHNCPILPPLNHRIYRLAALSPDSTCLDFSYSLVIGEDDTV